MGFWSKVEGPTYGLPDPKELIPVEEIRKTIDAVYRSAPTYRTISTLRLRQMIDVAYQDGYLAGRESR